MIKDIIFSVALSCPAPHIVNKTKIWNEEDKKTLSSATERCVLHYPDSPCLKIFRKSDEGIYQVVCGKP